MRQGGAGAAVLAGGVAVESLEQERTNTLAMVARLAGKEPKLGAVMESDPATIEDRHRKELLRTIDDLLRRDFLPDLRAPAAD